MPSSETKRCQSCGMPLTEGTFGTEADGSASSDYCKSCYIDGAFVKPDMTMDEMIKISIRHMTYDLNMNDETAEHLAKNTIPTLKRWRNSG
jgi:Putative zinc ribbon domain